jgi:hypothetical protein
MGLLYMNREIAFTFIVPIFPKLKKSLTGPFWGKYGNGK